MTVRVSSSAPVRNISLALFASLAASSFVACNSDETVNNPPSGAAGKGGSSAGTGGSSAGTGGTTAGSAGTTSGGSAGTTAGGSAGAAAGEGGSAGSGGAPAPELARVRIAHLVSDGPAVAVCARVHGTNASAPYALNVSKDLGGLPNGDRKSVV